MNTIQDMRRGAVASIPMIIGGIPFGLLFGSLASSYGLSPWFAVPMSMRIIMGFGLIDETYAAVRPMYEEGAADEKNGHKVYLGSFLSFYIMWNVTTILGVLSGELIPGMSEWGLEFAMVATFVGIITPYLKHKAFGLCLLSAGVSSIILSNLPNNLGLLVSAVIGVAVGFVSNTSSKVVSDSDDSIQEVIK